MQRVNFRSDIVAKYEKRLKGDFKSFVNHIHAHIMDSSASGSFEEQSDIIMGDARLAVRVYERYSMFGGNRVSLNVTVIGHESSIFVSAITSGGSQAVLFKVNTIGEESFLDVAVRAIDSFK